MSDSNQNQPSLVGGHAQYVKGAAEGAVGAVTGSEVWKDSAAKDKQAAIDDMKAAGQNRDPATRGFGRAEEVLGKAAGCEGMEEEGAASKTTQ